MNEKFFDLKKEKQDRMINAALKVFAENGFRRASTDEMVKEADLYKWICMGADQAAGAYFGDYIVMVLGSTEQIDAVFASFKKLHPDMSEVFYRIEREK